jgi:uncharacterized membrane protein YkgB
VQGGSNLIGVNRVDHRRLARGAALVAASLGATIMFATTLSFLFTTPGLSPEWQGFLMKDLVLVGAALWTAADSLRALERSTQ